MITANLAFIGPLLYQEAPRPIDLTPTVGYPLCQSVRIFRTSRQRHPTRHVSGSCGPFRR